MQPVVLIHYSEIGIKGGNRGFFERVLRDNLEWALAGSGCRRLHWLHGLFVAELAGEGDAPAALARLARVPGVAWFAAARRVPLVPDLQAVSEQAVALCAPLPPGSFRITTRRSVKSFPLTSDQVSARVGAAVVQAGSRPVDLIHPDLNCHIELSDRWAYLYLQRGEGLRGLPVGTSGRLVSLISAGIDSPVASFRMICRGCRLLFAHFHSLPYTGPQSLEQAARLVEVLAPLQQGARLLQIPFAPLQQRIIAGTPPRLRVVLYRRSMLRIAERLARREGAGALLTGESLGQVASQTLENLATIEEAVSLPVLRPLIGTDKESIVREAERIGTYAISIGPYDDCCSYLLPAQVETRSRPEEARQAESPILEDLHRLEEEALERAEERRVEGERNWSPSA